MCLKYRTLSNPAQELKPFEDWNAYVKSFARAEIKESVPNPAFNAIIPSDDILSKALDIAYLQHADAEEYLHEKFQNKWKTKQGGDVSFEQSLTNLPLYYARVKVNVTEMIRICETALNMFTNDPDWIYHIPQRNKILQRSDSIYLFHRYKASHKSDGGITLAGDRRDRNNVVSSISRAIVYPMSIDLIIKCMRYKDSKYRDIYNNDLANFFREQIFLSYFFEWINSYQNVDNYPEETIEEIISILKPKDCYGGDLKHMDMNDNLMSNSVMLQRIMNRLNYSPDEKSKVIKFLVAFFSSEVLVGDRIYYGLHNLLSGVGPTHDLENIQNLIVNTTGVVEMGFKPVFTIKQLTPKTAFILVKGDDHLVFFGRKLSEDERLMFGNIMKRNWAAFGQELELSKTMWGNQVIEYCKHMYALSNNVKGYKKREGLFTEVPISIYSLEKAIWNLRYPEHMPRFKDKRMLFIWFCVHMDCAYGCVGWKNAVSYLVAHIPYFKETGYLDYQPSNDDWEMMKRDWWFENFGSTDIQSSPTWIFVHDLLK